MVLSSKGGGRDVRKISHFIKPATLVGRNQYKEDYEGTIVSNPDEEMRWNVKFTNAEGNTEIHANTTLKLTYYVKWFNMTVITTS